MVKSSAVFGNTNQLFLTERAVLRVLSSPSFRGGGGQHGEPSPALPPSKPRPVAPRGAPLPPPPPRGPFGDLRTEGLWNRIPEPGV